MKCIVVFIRQYNITVTQKSLFTPVVTVSQYNADVFLPSTYNATLCWLFNSVPTSRGMCYKVSDAFYYKHVCCTPSVNTRHICEDIILVRISSLLFISYTWNVSSSMSTKSVYITLHQRWLDSEMVAVCRDHGKKKL